MTAIISRHFLLIATLAFSVRLPAQTTTEIAEDVGKSVVMIIVYDATGSAVAQGSGVFITNDGQILTNAHVLEDAYSVEVSSNIGTFDQVQILYKDKKRDLALIHVFTDQSVPPGLASDTDFKAGQRVIAIGNPFGLEKTVSDGLISGIRRTSDGVELIQITVPISPGSSGGVLLNEYGLVIGITTSTFHGGQNINFAIGLNTIIQFVEDYRKADPQRKSFELLKPAKESVWYRVVLHWIGNILAFLITLIFGSAFYYVIPLLLIAIYIVYGIIIGIWWIISYPFRRAKLRKEAETYQAYLASKPAQYGSSQSSLFNDEQSTKVEQTDSNKDASPNLPVVFHCWSCGSRLNLDKSMRGKTVECQFCHTQLTVPDEQITILLPYYLDESFSLLFGSYGFRVLWAQSVQELQRVVEYSEIDLAIEWQHGEQDFPIRNLIRRLNKNTPVFLALNWNGNKPANIEALGYKDSLTVPFKANEIREKFYAVLSPKKQSTLERSPLWRE